jgi:transposase
MSLKANPLNISDADRSILNSILNREATPARVTLRARILLGAAAGMSNHELASRYSVSRPCIIKWRRHYREKGLKGVRINRASSPSLNSIHQENAIVSNAYSFLHTGQHWTAETLAETMKISPHTVRGVIRRYKINPRAISRVGVYPKYVINPDPHFGRRMIALCGLHYEVDRVDTVLAIGAVPKEEFFDNRFVAGTIGNKVDTGMDAVLTALTALDWKFMMPIGKFEPPETLLAVKHEKPKSALLLFLEGLERSVSSHLEVHLICWVATKGFNDERVQNWLYVHPRFNIHFKAGIPWLMHVKRWFEVIKLSGRTRRMEGAEEVAKLVNEYVISTSERVGALQIVLTAGTT